MTQTSVERRYITGCWDYLPNKRLTEVVWDNMNDIDELQYTYRDHQFAKELQDTLDESTVKSAISNVPPHVRGEMRDAPIYSDPIKPYDNGEVFGGSTDVGDVSWITPTAQFRVATWPVGTPAHTWQAVAANGDFGETGLIYAAKILSGTAFDLLDKGSVLSEAAAEFQEQTDGDGYANALPDGAEPPFDAAGN
jgi:aminobenzoyl-glutamate utilization protein B